MKSKKRSPHKWRARIEELIYEVQAAYEESDTQSSFVISIISLILSAGALGLSIMVLLN